MPSPVKPIDISQLRQQLSPTPCNIVRDLVKAGHEAYIVGGAIRDLILGNVPKDYDISTSATPEEVRAVFGRRRCHVIGRRFRLAHVYSNGDIYEVSTFRRLPNQHERQGRKMDDGPIIWNDNCFGTLEDDALRRDFTCNCLYFDVTGERGIIDFCGGIEDIKRGVVRCIGEPAQRFDEDPVRMLRALKLVAQCEFELEPELAKALREKAPSIKLASSSRLFEELLKILNNPLAYRTFQVMHDYGFLKYFWPTLDEAWGEQAGEMVRHLLQLRGDSMRSGHYSNSRGLALATVVLPFIMFAMNPENPAELWKRSADTDEIFRRALNLIFEGFQLPHVFQDRIRQMIGLVPRLLNGSPISRQKALNHPEYRYARALLVLLIRLFGWSQEKLNDLPEFSPVYEDHETQGRRGRRRASHETPAAEGVTKQVTEEEKSPFAEETAASSEEMFEAEAAPDAAGADEWGFDGVSGVEKDIPVLSVEDATAAEVTETVAEVTETVAETTSEPAVEVTETAVEITEPAVEITEPAVEVTEPAADAGDNAVKCEALVKSVTGLVPLKRGGTVPVVVPARSKRSFERPRAVFVEYIAPAPVEGKARMDSITFTPHGHPALVPLTKNGNHGDRRNYNRQNKEVEK